MTDGDRHPRRPGRGPVLSSVALHAFLLVAVWWAQRIPTDPYEYVAYEMTIVSLPTDPVDEPVAVEVPDVVERTDAPPPPEPQPQPEPELPEPEPELRPAPAEPEPEPPPAREPDPAPTPEAPVTAEAPSAAAMAVRMEGLRRDFPEYYQRIIGEVDRCFRWTGAATFTAVLRFEIRRDGTIPGSSISVFTRSGNPLFDIAARGAVECAGRDRLGPLPDDMPIDILPVQFTFGQPRPGGE